MSFNTPVRLWGLDPLFRCNIKLFISQIQKLEEIHNFQGVYNLFGHPVTRFEVVGVITSLSCKEKFIKIAVDDGTAVIFACFWFDDKIGEENVEKFELGQLVSVFGKIKLFREEKELVADKIILQTDRNFEAHHWINVIQLYETYKKEVVYTPPTNPTNDSI